MGAAMTEVGPHSIELEQELLGGVMVWPDTLNHCGDLGAHDFCEPLHGRIWEAICGLIRDGNKPMPLHVANRMGTDTGLEEVGGSGYLANLAAASLHPDAVRQSVESLRDLAIRRMGLMAAGDLTADLYENREKPASAILLNFKSDLGEIAQRGMSGSPRTFAEAIDEVLDRQKAGQTQVYATGLKDLDTILGGGLRPKQLCYLGGRPAMGKTTAGMNIALNVARAGLGVLVFSLEMDRNRLVQRMLSDLLFHDGIKMPFSAMQAPPDDETLRTLEEARCRWASLPIHIDDGRGKSCSALMAEAMRAAEHFNDAETPLTLIVVDWTGHIQPSDRYRGNRHMELTEISSDLVDLARETGASVLALHQLSKEVERRENRVPMLSDLRESGSLEQDADVVIFVHRPEYYLDQQRPDRADEESYATYLGKRMKVGGRMDFIVAKNRNGGTGTAHTQAILAYHAVRDAADGGAWG